MFFLCQGKAQQVTIAKDFNACLYGLIDQYGNWIVPAKYNHISNFDYYGYAIVLKDNLYGLIDKKGKEVIPPIYDALQTWPENQNNYIVNPSNELISENTYHTGNYLFYYKATKQDLCGVLDTAGKEIVPIKYKYLEPFLNGYSIFTSADGKVKGFLDYHGVRGIIPPELLVKFDYSQKTQQGIFIISRWEYTDAKKKKSKTYCGAMNDSARMVLPMEFDSINISSGYKNIIEAYKDGKTFYYKKDGTKLFSEGYFIPGERYLKVPQLILKGNTPANNGIKWGVIGITGKIILDFKYDSIKPFTSYLSNDSLGPKWEILEKDKWGLIDKSGEWMLKPDYENIYPNSWRMSGTNPEYIFMAKANGNWGAVNSKGNEILPFIYDTLFQYDNGYIFWSENSTDFLSYKLTEPYVALYDYDVLKARKAAENEWKEKNKNKSDSLINEDEQFHYFDPVEYRYDREGESYHRSILYIGDYNKYDPKHSKHYEFGKYLPLYSSISISNLKQSTTIDKNVFLYSPIPITHNRSYAIDDYQDGDYGTTPIAISELSDGKINFSSAQFLWKDSVFKYYSITMHYPKTKTNAEFDSPEIIRSDGKVTLRAGILRNLNVISFYSKPTYLVTDISGNYGIMDLNGDFLIDTTWDFINPVSSNLAWVKKVRSGNNCDGEWNQYVINKKQLLFPLTEQFITPVQTSFNNSIAFTSTGGGIYNSMQKQFVLPPVYRAFYDLNEPVNQFAVMTCNGHIGIFDSNGKMIVDTIWNSIIRISTSSNTWNAKSPPSREQFLLFNNKDWGMYDTQTGFSKGDSLLAMKVIYEAENQQGWSREKNSIKTCTDCPWLYGPEVKNFKSWQQQLIFDSLYRSSSTIDYRMNRNEGRYDCTCKNVYTLPWEKYSSHEINKPIYKRVHFALKYQTDSTLMLEKSTSNESYDSYDWLPAYYAWNITYYNIFLFPEGQRVMTLDSLFIGEDWKLIIENATMNFLRENPGINANCSNPAMYPKLFNELFLIDGNGLTFYPRWSFSDENKKKERISFLIPWIKLRPFLRKDVSEKLKLN